MALSPDLRSMLLKRLAKASNDVMSLEQISETTLLREDLKLDSLEMVTLVFDLQDELGVAIEDEELSTIVTVGNLLDIVDTKLLNLQEDSDKQI